MSEKMKVVWCDTETTGIDPKEAGAFEIALIVYEGGDVLGEKVFNLNPLNENIKYSEEAAKVHGVTEKEIRAFPSAEKVMPEIGAWLNQWLPEDLTNYRDSANKYVFAGYRADFDYAHLKALFERYGISMGSYFSGRLIDVYERVKRVNAMGFLPKTENQKLSTMTKALGITHEAHSALSDIKATRRLYEAIYVIERSERL